MRRRSEGLEGNGTATLVVRWRRGGILAGAASHDREDIGLERVFKDLFPITDVHGNFSLEFVRHTLAGPKYTVEECTDRDMTYSAPLKATLRLVINEVYRKAKCVLLQLKP